MFADDNISEFNPISTRSQDSLMPIAEIKKENEKVKKPETIPILDFTNLYESELSSDSNDTSDESDDESIDQN
jgi:hypothetical protein